VKITFLKNDKETDWQSDVLEQLPHEIESLQDQGFSLKEIAIVVRWNSEAVRVAETLLTYAQTHTASPYRYDFISNEALLISSAQSVKAVIALMRHFRNPQDNTRRMMAAYEYYRLHQHATPDKALQLYRESGNDFPEEVKHHLHELSSLPFYDMIERFFCTLCRCTQRTGECICPGFSGPRTFIQYPHLNRFGCFPRLVGRRRMSKDTLHSRRTGCHPSDHHP